MSRVVRNFWLLVAAAVVAVGLLSTTLRMPPSPLVGLATAICGVAAVAALALAGRILVVVTQLRATRARSRRAGPGREQRTP